MNMNSFIRTFTDKDFGEIILFKKKYYFKKEQKNTRELFSPGIPLGDYNKEFEPSIYFLELLSKESKNKVFINDQAEWLFLCGRDVFYKNIVKDNSSNELFLVQNERDENLGLGKFMMQGKNKLVKNIKDRGDFLRRER